MVGEIGGDEEEKAAAFIEAELTKPVVAYIAGFTAPPGKTMGHAGAIISGSSGTAEAKKAALEAKGIRVGTTPTETAELVAEIARRIGPARGEAPPLAVRPGRQPRRRDLRDDPRHVDRRGGGLERRDLAIARDRRGDGRRLLARARVRPRARLVARREREVLPPRAAADRASRSGRCCRRPSSRRSRSSPEGSASSARRPPTGSRSATAS